MNAFLLTLEYLVSSSITNTLASPSTGVVGSFSLSQGWSGVSCCCAAHAITIPHHYYNSSLNYNNSCPSLLHHTILCTVRHMHASTWRELYIFYYCSFLNNCQRRRITIKEYAIISNSRCCTPLFTHGRSEALSVANNSDHSY